MLDTKLIEKALALTGKTMSDVKIFNPSMELEVSYQFSMENFCYYLISEEFIDQYQKFDSHNLNPEVDFLYAIRDYQKGNEEPLIFLLSEI